MSDVPNLRPFLEPPIFERKIDLFTNDGKQGPPVCGSCGAGVGATACVSYCTAARSYKPIHNARVFLCAGCVLEAFRLLAEADEMHVTKP